MSDPDPSRSPLGLSLLPAIVFSLFLLGCSADVAIIATPVSGGLFDQEHLEAARERGVGRVVLVAPGDLSRPGIVRPGVGEETALLLMPDVASEEVATIEGRSRLALSLDHGNSGAGVLALDRRPAFGRLGELVGEYVGNGLENDRRDAETITVRVFALQGGEDRIAEMRALLEPIRRRIPAEAIVVEEVVSGFSVSAIQERLREAGPKDPLLLFLGAAGSELFSQAREGEGPVAGEALFVPAQSVPLAEGASLEPGDALLLGVDPVDLFEATKAGETARIEAQLFRASDLF